MRIIDIEKSVGNFHLKIDDLKIEEGMIHGLIGPNGCGKTTLAKIIMGITPYDSGEVDLEGILPEEMTMTSQRPYLLHATVYENIIYPLKIRKIEPNKKEIDQLLGKCGLLEKKEQQARSLSSGERQKVSLVRALIFNPKLIIIDESLSNLDMESVAYFEDMILERQKENPVTLILVSHQLVHIHKMCERVHFISEGRLIESGMADEVLLKSRNPEIQKYRRMQMIEMRNEA